MTTLTARGSGPVQLGMKPRNLLLRKGDVPIRIAPDSGGVRLLQMEHPFRFVGNCMKPPT
jgi:hypothetical protein